MSIQQLDWQNEQSAGGGHKTVVIHAGGAMAMMVDNDRGFTMTAESHAFLESRFKTTESFYQPDMPTWALIHSPQPKDSSYLTPEDWTAIGQTIADIYDECDSVVIIMGTDTLAYCASALSFMLENIHKPIVLTGAMVPIQQTRSDAMMNIIGAMQMAMLSNVPEVCIFFSGHLMRGNRCTKMRCTTYIGAFESPNYPPLGSVGVGVSVYRSVAMKEGRGPFNFYPMSISGRGGPVNNKVILLRLFPGMDHGWVEKMLDLKPKGIIIETYGSGNAPSCLVPALIRAIQDDVVIINVTQCVKGTVVQETYKVGNYLSEAGIISGRDMTVEAAVAKLTFLLGQRYTTEKVKYLMCLPLAGELKR